jgi:hypothetical protein
MKKYVYLSRGFLKSTGMLLGTLFLFFALHSLFAAFEPLNLQVDSQTNPPRVVTSTPSFSAVFYSPTSTAFAISYEIQITTSSGNWDTPLYFDSGMQPLARSTPVDMRSPQILGPTFPQDGRSYFWRIKFFDQYGNGGAWSVEESYFAIAVPPSSLSHTLAIQDVITQSFFSNKYVEPFANDSVMQTVSCLVVDGDVTGIALFGRGNGLPQTARVYLTDDAGHTSDIQEFFGTTTAVTAGNWLFGFRKYVFTFPEPINCKEGVLSFQIHILDAGSIILDGAINEVFPWGDCIGVRCVQVKDLYFEVIGVSEINTNHAPVFDSIGNRTANEGALIEFMVNATDPDNDALAYTASNLPLGASFSTSTRVFSWTPSFNQSGNYLDIEFTVMDSGEPMELGTELIMITVGNVNRSPVFAPVGTQAALEGETISFVVSVTDPDADGVVLIASGTPAGALFNASTGLFSWTPTLVQAGAYVAEFFATDNGVPNLTTLLEVPLTIGDNPTLIEQAEVIIDTVIDYNFPTNVENSYLANLKKVAKFIEEGKIAAACNQLNTFIAKVENDIATGIIGQTEGTELLALANALLDDLQ